MPVKENLLHNVTAGQVCIYSDENEIQFWSQGCCTVSVCDPITMCDIDVYSWSNAPETIEEAINEAKAHIC